MGKRRQRGQSTVEFGASAIVLILLLLGLVDFGRAFYFGVGMRGATREGARQAIWFDPSSTMDFGCGPSPHGYLCDTAIKSAVDAILLNSGLPASQLQNPGTTCPDVADGNGSHNPPYAGSAYATTSVNQPLLYICYANTPGLDVVTAPTDASFNGTDVNVILVMNFGFTTGFMQGVLGSSVQMVANTHMSVGGY
ncbi:MAG TPA: TadE/TadG family type IV pilus assembly protein [Verrucomicrobiae bacterium]|nr:TadE/TadG family type IV pilus assembly protein [Verrucomicrobiae bacterium]